MATATVRGLSMNYTEAGAGAPVVLLHGFPFNHSMWRGQVEALRHTHRVITPDLRGHGATSVTSEAATMEEMAQDVAALLDQLEVERATFGALSMGGYVTLAFCRLFPQRVRALILADTRPHADTNEARANREAMAQHALAEGMAAIAETMLPKLLAPATLNDQPEITARVREMILNTQPEGAAAALRGMARRRDQTSLLPEILAPTLIIVGSEDALTPPADSELMHREIRGSQLVVIEGAGHVSNIERPTEFNDALTKFLRALEVR